MCPPVFSLDVHVSCMYDMIARKQSNGHKTSVSMLLKMNKPVKQLKLLNAWLILHEDELYAAWNNAVRGMRFDKIEPLR